MFEIPKRRKGEEPLVSYSPLACITSINSQSNPEWKGRASSFYKGGRSHSQMAEMGLSDCESHGLDHGHLPGHSPTFQQTRQGKAVKWVP